jgi:hypothetical protein
MNATNMGNGLDEALKEQFAKLPKVVQDAITSADVEKHMRELANTHKLHLDQWQKLENEVMLALLGIQSADDLEKNIRSEVVVSSETAKALTESISKIVFQPIRAELERQLEHPEAKAATVSGVEAARTQVLGETAAPAVAPATPPAAPPTTRVERAPISAAYKAGEASSARASVHDDPYREPPA